MATLNLVKKSDCFRFLFVTIVLLFVLFFFSFIFYFNYIFNLLPLYLLFFSNYFIFRGVWGREVWGCSSSKNLQVWDWQDFITFLFVCLFVFVFFCFFVFFLILQFCKAFLFFFSYACLSVCLYVCNISFFDIIKVGHLQNV